MKKHSSVVDLTKVCTQLLASHMYACTHINYLNSTSGVPYTIRRHSTQAEAHNGGFPLWCVGR